MILKNSGCAPLFLLPTGVDQEGLFCFGFSEL